MVYGKQYLMRKLATKQARVLKRYKYYEMKNHIDEFRGLTPKGFESLSATLGWCAKSVDALADRIVFRGFENDNFDMSSIFKMNNQDVLVDSMVLGALITSCDFVYIYKGEQDFPALKVIDGYNATGIIDPVTNLLKEGYAVLERDENGRVVRDAYFDNEATYIHDVNISDELVIKNETAYPLLVPIINRPDAKRPFGHSRISRACMNIQQSALRTLKRSEVSAEFYSFPQKYVLGTDPDAEVLDKFKATMSTMLEFSKDGDGDRPVVGQFQQQSMTPFIEQLKMFASLFAGETGLTLDDLGFATENPSSAEAIKSAHENLRLQARKAQRDLSVGLINVGYLATSLRDGKAYRRSQIYNTICKFDPIFEPDMNTLSLIGDGAIKINQAIPNYLSKDSLYDLTGIKPNDKASSTLIDLSIGGE